MKKIIFILVAVLAISGTVSAQKKVEWGVKGGLNISSLSNPKLFVEEGTDLYTLKGKMKPSFYAGLFLDYTINDYIGIQPEVLYSRQGSTYKEHGLKFDLRSEYINVPVLAKIYLFDKFSIDLGPQIGFNLKSQLVDRSLDGYKLVMDTKEIFYDKDDVRIEQQTIDFAVAMGLSYKKLFNKIDVSARYNLGITEIMKKNPAENIEDIYYMESGKKRNNVIQVGIGYRF